MVSPCLDRVGEPPRALVHVLEAATGREGNRGSSARGGGRGRRARRRGRAAARRPARPSSDRRLARAPPAPRLAADRPFDVRGECSCRQSLAADRAAARAVSPGECGDGMAEKPLPPATPNRSRAIPNSRLMKLSDRSMLWILASRQDGQPPPPPAGADQQPVAVERVARCAARPASGARSAADQRRPRQGRPRAGTCSCRRPAISSSGAIGNGERPDIGRRDRAATSIGRPTGRQPSSARIASTSSSRASGARTWSPLPPSSLGEALQLEFAPAEAVAHGPVRDDRRLGAACRQRHVGPGEQAAAAAQADSPCGRGGSRIRAATVRTIPVARPISDQHARSRQAPRRRDGRE